MAQAEEELRVANYTHISVSRLGPTASNADRFARPGFSNSLIGLLATLAAVLVTNDGDYTIDAQIGTALVLFSGVAMLTLSVVYAQLIKKKKGSSEGDQLFRDPQQIT